MYEKLENGDDLFDHEVLEILLYAVCPRINTNPLAHKLMDRFVTLYNVLNASVKELKGVDGVGDAVAKYLRSVGMSAERAGRIGNTPSLKTFGDCKRFLHLRFFNKTVENVEIYFTDGESRVKRIFNYSTSEKSRAIANADDIARNVALIRPVNVIIAHNHVSGTTAPSCYDDDGASTEMLRPDTLRVSEIFSRGTSRRAASSSGEGRRSFSCSNFDSSLLILFNAPT